MTKARKGAPLITRPIGDILAAARAAGRAHHSAYLDGAEAFLTAKGASMDWLDVNLPNSLDLMSDDAFGELMEACITAFTESATDVKAKKIALDFEGACVELSIVSKDFCDLASLFQAIAAASEPFSLARRLADFGQHIRDDKDSAYQHESDRLSAIVRGYLACLDQEEVA